MLHYLLKIGRVENEACFNEQVREQIIDLLEVSLNN